MAKASFRQARTRRSSATDVKETEPEETEGNGKVVSSVTPEQARETLRQKAAARRASREVVVDKETTQEDPEPSKEIVLADKMTTTHQMAERMEQEEEDSANTQLNLINLVSNPVGEGIGEFDERDIVLPIKWISMLQSNSNLVKEGEFLCGDVIMRASSQEPAYLLYSPPTKKAEGTAPLTMVFLNMEKKWMEEVDFDSGIQAKIWDHKKQAEAEGYKLFAGSDDNGFRPFFVALVFVKQPADDVDNEDIEEWFPYEFQGERWGLCVWQLRGGSARGVGSKVFTTVKRKGGGYYPSRTWEVTTKLEPHPTKKNMTYNKAIIKDVAPTDDDFIAFIEETASNMDNEDSGE